jgi:iron complex transport system substrate-binding protein
LNPAQAEFGGPGEREADQRGSGLPSEIMRRAKVLLLALTLAAVVRGESVIVDSLGRNIALPGSVGRVLSLQPEITRIILCLGAGDRLVGVDYFMRRHDHLFPILFPQGRDLPAASNTTEDMNYEMVMRLDPDVIFVSPTELRTVDTLQEKMAKPVVALASMGRFAGLLEEMKIVGRILGREARAFELAGDFQARTSEIRARNSAIPMEKRPRIYLSFWGALGRTPVAYEPVEAAGGRNCADGLLPAYLGTIATVAQIEQIVAWRPDIVLVQGNYPADDRPLSVADVLEDARLGSIPAIQNRSVFYTFGFWFWWDPALVLIETIYLDHLFHPASTGTFDLRKEGDAIFKKYYGAEGAFSALCRVLECASWDEK